LRWNCSVSTMAPVGSRVEMELFRLNRGTGRQQCRCIVPKLYMQSKRVLLRKENLSPEIFRAELKRLKKRKRCCILLVVYVVVLMMHGHTNIKFEMYLSYSLKKAL